MTSFTLDTNCIVAVAEGRAEAAAIEHLADAHCAGQADVAVAVSMASEWIPADYPASSIDNFEQRLTAVALAHLGRCYPVCVWGLTYWDNCLWGGDEDLDQQLQSILFPNVESSLDEFCRARRLRFPDEGNELTREYRPWLNAKCDVLALWSHINARREVFVTSDANFHKLTKRTRLIQLGAGAIEKPGEAAARLRTGE